MSNAYELTCDRLFAIDRGQNLKSKVYNCEAPITGYGLWANEPERDVNVAGSKEQMKRIVGSRKYFKPMGE